MKTQLPYLIGALILFCLEGFEPSTVERIIAYLVVFVTASVVVFKLDRGLDKKS